MSHNYDDLRCYSCDQFCCNCELCKCCRKAIADHGHIATVIAAKDDEIERLRELGENVAFALSRLCGDKPPEDAADALTAWWLGQPICD